MFLLLSKAFAAIQYGQESPEYIVTFFITNTYDLFKFFQPFFFDNLNFFLMFG
jgi:hypothetical protein